MILPKKSLLDVERKFHPYRGRENFVTLERNERTTDFPPHVIEDLRNLMTGFLLRAYPDLEDFYETLASWLGVSRAHLLVTGGADGALKAVWETYVDVGDEVVILNPSYAMYPVYCQIFGAKKIEVTYEADLSLSVDSITARVRQGTRLLAMANPNQPIESFFSLDELRQLARHCLASGTIFLVDEAYFHFNDVTALPLTREFENVAVVRTFSKAFGIAGLRLGYLVGSPEVAKHCTKMKPIYEVNALTGAVGQYLLKNDHIMKDCVAAVNQGREVLVSYFGKRGFPTHGRASNTILVELPRRLDSRKVAEGLKDAGILVRGEATPPAANHLRITLGPKEQMELLLQKLEPLL